MGNQCHILQKRDEFEVYFPRISAQVHPRVRPTANGTVELRSHASGRHTQPSGCTIDLSIIGESRDDRVAAALAFDVSLKECNHHHCWNRY